jgi:hypothetical protein
MPSFNITIPETIESVSRPIIYSILETIKKYLLIRDDVRVIFPGDIGIWTQTAGGLKDTTKESQFTSSRYMEIDIEQEPVDTNINSTAVYYAENPPIILDPGLGIQVTPIYSRTKVELNIKFVTFNKDESFRWYYNARTQVAKMQDVYINTIQYHYPLPDPLMDLIETIYTLKENVAPDNETFQQYVLRTFTKKATTIAALDGSGQRVAIAETQTRLLGRFEFEPLPEKPELIDDIQAWACNFKYVFTYDLPMSLNLIYPIMVHNQFLPEPFLDYSFDPYHLDDKDLLFPQTLKALRAFEPDRMWSDDPVFRIPKFDTFTPNYTVKGLKTIFSAMIQISENDLTSLLNLNDLDYLELSSALLLFLKDSEYQYLTTPFQSVFNVSLYADSQLQDYSILNCDSDLNITSSVDLNLKKTYRIVFSVVDDFMALSPEAIYRLFYFTPTIEAQSSYSPETSDYPLNYGQAFSDILKLSSNVSLTSSQVENLSGGVEYSYGNSNLPFNINLIENYISELLNRDKAYYLGPNVNWEKDFSALYSQLTDYQKFLLIGNLFTNPNAIQTSLSNNGSDIFKEYISLLGLSPLDINFWYRTRMGKNLYNNTATTNNYLNNPRSQTDKTFNLMSAPLINSNNTRNYIGFKSVMVSGILAVRSTVRTTGS